MATSANMSSGAANEELSLKRAAGQCAEITDQSGFTACRPNPHSHVKYEIQRGENYITAADEELNGRCWDAAGVTADWTNSSNLLPSAIPYLSPLPRRRAIRSYFCTRRGAAPLNSHPSHPADDADRSQPSGERVALKLPLTPVFLRRCGEEHQHASGPVPQLR